MAGDERRGEWQDVVRLARARALQRGIAILWDRLAIDAAERQATLALAETLPPAHPDAAPGAGNGRA